MTSNHHLKKAKIWLQSQSTRHRHTSTKKDLSSQWKRMNRYQQQYQMEIPGTVRPFISGYHIFSNRRRRICPYLAQRVFPPKIVHFGMSGLILGHHLQLILEIQLYLQHYLTPSRRNSSNVNPAWRKRLSTLIDGNEPSLQRLPTSHRASCKRSVTWVNTSREPTRTRLGSRESQVAIDSLHFCGEILWITLI